MANADFAPLSLPGEITAISVRCLDNASAKIFSGKNCVDPFIFIRVRINVPRQVKETLRSSAKHDCVLAMCLTCDMQCAQVKCTMAPELQMMENKTSGERK
jgi:hypothetical protein